MLDINETAVESKVVETAPAVIVPLEIDVVERKGRVVEDPPIEFTFTPFMLEINAMAVDKLMVETEPDVVTPVVFVVVAFTVAADAVPVTVREPTPAAVVTVREFADAAPVTAKDPTPAAFVTVREFADAAPVTAKDPIPAAVVTVRVPVTVLLGVYNEPPCIDPENTAVAPFTAPVAVILLAPRFPENEPLVPEIAPPEVREPTWALFVTRIALPNIPLLAWNCPTLQRFAPVSVIELLINFMIALLVVNVDMDAEFAFRLSSLLRMAVHCP